MTLLGGCAGAQITNIASTKVTGPQPAQILVDVDVVPVPNTSEMKLAEEVATKLKADLIKRLQEAKLTTEPFVPGIRHPGAAILHVAIMKADKGNPVTRLVIGFGVGRAELQAKADFVNDDSAPVHSMTAFKTSSDSGFMPGLIVPGGAALATAHVVTLAVGGGIRVVTGLRDGLNKPIRGTSIAIVEQLKKYYASVGWRWPAGDIV